MHFSKTYTQLLLSLPPDLRENAMDYRQLKKVINCIVIELSGLGLKPAILHELIEASEGVIPAAGTIHEETTLEVPPPAQSISEPDDGSSSTDLPPPSPAESAAETWFSPIPRVVYELNSISGRIEPKLRIWISRPAPEMEVSKDVGVHLSRALEALQLDEEGEALEVEGSVVGSHKSLLWSLQQKGFEGAQVEDRDGLDQLIPGSSMQEIVVPLVHDTEFYSLLSGKLESISEHLTGLQTEFVDSLQELSRTIGDTTHPASVAASFQPLSSITTDAGSVRVKTGELKSDLYSWREIFQIYLEAEVFEAVGERTRGERTVEESEKRLQQFAQRVTQNGLGDTRKFKLKQSIEALETFLSLNLFILNIKKFSHANSEATRKILKKHAKRTSLFMPVLPPGILPRGGASPPLALMANSTTTFSLPRILVQAIGEKLLPIISSIEDYSCLICTSIAFKPIRLSCGHLFCVRCLVKMQKRKQGDCPMCRSPSVLVANRTNVDWALLNFMQDWFPLESREKLKMNEKEASEEEMKELGIDPSQPCVVM
ncbi:hypothetical protein M413DRAFT_443563 [Hebeloma cylindrosporum]|uniref:RING-type domain-containing protein n=1 Tax=Hebeloma cylindrosporum TaxID=76867 RepID=A0A0C2Y1F1_HEBCY|nr:hypothetical protein M413DRAFT_443563 [Hebeloma cylindrosporum h7]